MNQSSDSLRARLNLHGFRDEAKTLLHLQGKREGLDLECVDFWMGHVTDPNNYDKFFRDRGYTLEMYQIAEKYLNIVSGGIQTHTGDVKELAKQLIKDKGSLKILAESLAEELGARLVPVEK